MNRRAIFPMLAVAYCAACFGILVLTKPWHGGDGSISFGILMNVVSFPAGLVPTFLLSFLTDAAHGTSFENAITISPLWWLSLLVGCGAFGYVQWLVVLPRLAKAVKNRLLTTRWSGP